MTTLRNVLFGILPRATTFQVISITQWLTSKNCLAKKAMHFSRNRSLEINQSVKDYQNAPDNIFRERPERGFHESVGGEFYSAQVACIENLDAESVFSGPVRYADELNVNYLEPPIEI